MSATNSYDQHLFLVWHVKGKSRNCLSSLLYFSFLVDSISDSPETDFGLMKLGSLGDRAVAQKSIFRRPDFDAVPSQDRETAVPRRRGVARRCANAHAAALSLLLAGRASASGVTRDSKAVRDRGNTTTGHHGWHMRSCCRGGCQRRRRLRGDSWACHLARLRPAAHGTRRA